MRKRVRLLQTVAGAGRVPVEVVETTGYPFEEEIAFSFTAAQPVAFPFSLRIPEWCSEPHLSVNGVRAPLSARRKRYATLHREFKAGDKVVLRLPMKLAISRWPQGGIGIEHGPLVFSLPIRRIGSALWRPARGIMGSISMRLR